MPPASWSGADDQVVWAALGNQPRGGSGKLVSSDRVNALVHGLASRFGRTDSAITSRLRHLDDPTHSAYARLHGAAPPPNRQRHITAPSGSSEAPLPLHPMFAPKPAAGTGIAPPPPADLNAGQRDCFGRVCS
ncbi:hypothetical protein T492DRAFT_887522, partial [Pavlovales sp. CCMP2436]